MVPLALGFPGERFIYLPLPLIEVMKNSTLSKELITYSLVFFHMPNIIISIA